MFNKLLNLFENLDTEYLRFNKFESLGFLIPPTEFVVGNRLETHTKNDIPLLRSINVTAQFIPLRVVFQKVF